MKITVVYIGVLGRKKPTLSILRFWDFSFFLYFAKMTHKNITEGCDLLLQNLRKDVTH